MSGKDLFQRDKKLCAWWVGITHDDRFEQVLALVRAELSEQTLEREQMAGANKAFQTLCTIVENEPSDGVVVKTRLDHRSVAEILAEQKKQEKQPEKE
jgi:hypothetical protein